MKLKGFKSGFEERAKEEDPLGLWKKLSDKKGKKDIVSLDARDASEDRGSWKHHSDMYSFSSG